MNVPVSDSDLRLVTRVNRANGRRITLLRDEVIIILGEYATQNVGSLDDATELNPLVTDEFLYWPVKDGIDLESGVLRNKLLFSTFKNRWTRQEEMLDLFVVQPPILVGDEWLAYYCTPEYDHQCARNASTLEDALKAFDQYEDQKLVNKIKAAYRLAYRNEGR